ncbi:phenylacetate--CoA ligase family protein [Ectopseudomonas oleovorans]|uniref:Phenylacetate-CoA ligase n=1 Tax=Ectopseudomonas oleovorans TaxID=301 RepID=A0A3D9EIV8_ECTOL|nr:hypothetical protein [Pseudomonas oleovorans]RED02927.1 phenylacetate-CoA ligase [Pseudomonas oleovorans]
MIRASHPILKLSEFVFARQPLRLLKGMVSAHIAYPIAEKHEGRHITPKLDELRRHYALSSEERLKVSQRRLVDMLNFAGTHVPYYKDLFRKTSFDPDSVDRDVNYLEKLPYLDKSIILEQGERLLSNPLQEIKHHACKTGGSTGRSVTIFYDQESADYSAAVTLYARERIGKGKSQPALHFACRFPDAAESTWPNREDFKCFAMNRSNIFFDRVDEKGLAEIWKTLQRRRPYLIHEHPSTIYALACYIESRLGDAKAFDVFESSGELLQPYMREKIEKVLNCRVIDRYGLAEFGVTAYQLDAEREELQLFDSEVWPESRPGDEGSTELVLTGLRNRLMPLIRYATGDCGRLQRGEQGFHLDQLIGRIHDIVPINGVPYPTHHIMDMLDHRVGGIEEFQIDVRGPKAILRIVPMPHSRVEDIESGVRRYWGDAFHIEFVTHDGFVRVGRRAKFRHVVNA